MSVANFASEINLKASRGNVSDRQDKLGFVITGRNNWCRDHGTIVSDILSKICNIRLIYLFGIRLKTAFISTSAIKFSLSPICLGKQITRGSKNVKDYQSKNTLGMHILLALVETKSELKQLSPRQKPKKRWNGYKIVGQLIQRIFSGTLRQCATITNLVVIKMLEWYTRSSKTIEIQFVQS